MHLFNDARSIDLVPDDDVSIVGFRHILKTVQYIDTSNNNDNQQMIQLFHDFGAKGIERGGGLSFPDFRSSLRPKSKRKVFRSSIIQQEKIRTASRRSRRRMRQLQSSMSNSFPMNALGQTPHIVSNKSIESSPIGMNMNMSVESGWSVLRTSQSNSILVTDSIVDDGGMLIMDHNLDTNGGSQLPSLLLNSKAQEKGNYYHNGINGARSTLLDEMGENSFLPFIRLAAASARASNALLEQDDQCHMNDQKSEHMNSREYDHYANSEIPSGSQLWWEDPDSEQMLARQMEVDLILGSPSPAFDPSVPFTRSTENKPVMSMKSFKVNPVEQINQYHGVLERAIQRLKKSKILEKTAKEMEEKQNNRYSKRKRRKRKKKVKNATLSLVTKSTTSNGNGESVIDVDNVDTTTSTTSSIQPFKKKLKNKDENDILNKWWMERRMNVIHSQLLPTIEGHEKRPQSAGSFLESSSNDYLINFSDLTPRPSTSHEEKRTNVYILNDENDDDEKNTNEKRIAIQHKSETLEDMLQLENELKNELKRLRVLKRKRKQLKLKKKRDLMLKKKIQHHKLKLVKENQLNILLQEESKLKKELNSIKKETRKHRHFVQEQLETMLHTEAELTYELANMRHERYMENTVGGIGTTTNQATNEDNKNIENVHKNLLFGNRFGGPFVISFIQFSGK